MLRRLLPKETGFFDFFEQHAQVLVQASHHLLKATQEEGFAAAHPKGLRELEHQADHITQQCIEALHKTFITPLERNDIHRLISALDDVVDFIDAVFGRMRLYEIQMPAPRMVDACQNIVTAAESIQRAVSGLRDLRRAKAILHECDVIKKCEKHGDATYAKALAQLFKEETNAIVVIKWREIYETLENAADACEDVANIIEGIVLEHL